VKWIFIRVYCYDVFRILHLPICRLLALSVIEKCWSHYNILNIFHTKVIWHCFGKKNLFSAQPICQTCEKCTNKKNGTMNRQFVAQDNLSRYSMPHFPLFFKMLYHMTLTWNVRRQIIQMIMKCNFWRVCKKSIYGTIWWFKTVLSPSNCHTCDKSAMCDNLADPTQGQIYHIKLDI
jgi:hypothetical protein